MNKRDHIYRHKGTSIPYNYQQDHILGILMIIFILNSCKKKNPTKNRGVLQWDCSG